MKPQGVVSSGVKTKKFLFFMNSICFFLLPFVEIA